MTTDSIVRKSDSIGQELRKLADLYDAGKARALCIVAIDDGYMGSVTYESPHAAQTAMLLGYMEIAKREMP